MMKKVIFLCALCWACLSFVQAQQRVAQLPVGLNEVPSDHSFCYMLPKTLFKLDVTVTRKTELKGYFSDYAEKLLGLKHVIAADRTLYELKNVSLSAVTSPDSNYIYAVELSPSPKNRRLLADMQRPAVQPQVFTDTYTADVIEIPEFFKNYSDVAFVEKEDSYVETKIVNGVVVQVPVNQTKIVVKSLDKQAQEAADFITKIRAARYDLTAGVQEVAYSKEAMEYMVQELNQLEKNYLDLFTGLTVADELHYTLFVSPLESSEQQYAFTIDPLHGFSGDEGGTGHHYYLNYQRQYDNRQAEAFSLMKWKVKKYKFNEGYRIRQAVPAYVSLTLASRPLTVFGLYPVYQFGKIVTLPCQEDMPDIMRYDVVVY